MKKVTVTVLLIATLILTCFALAACGENEPAHTHNYSTLKFDNESHWFECECEEKNNIVFHNIKNGECACGYVVPHSHEYSMLKNDANAQSCTEEGNIEYYTCDCGKWFTDNTATTEILDKASVVIGKDAHTYTISKHSETQHWYECICGDKSGIEAHSWQDTDCESPTTCTICSAIAETETGYEAGHDWIVATCTTPATCRVCGITGSSAYGHNYSSWDIWDYPTCTEEGHEVSWCTLCENCELRPVKPHGHKYVAGICSVCGDDSNVYADVSGVTLNHTTLNLYIGDTSQLEATIAPENAKEKTVKWFTSDDAVVQISSSGKITAKGKGSATITVTTVDGNYSATCIVTVTEPPLTVKISMGVGLFMSSSGSAQGVFAEAIASGGSGNYVEYHLKVYHNGTLVAEGAKSELIVTLANGIYTAEVYVKDSSCNEATASETFSCQGY